MVSRFIMGAVLINVVTLNACENETLSHRGARSSYDVVLRLQKFKDELPEVYARRAESSLLEAIMNQKVRGTDELLFSDLEEKVVLSMKPIMKQVAVKRAKAMPSETYLSVRYLH